MSRALALAFLAVAAIAPVAGAQVVPRRAPPDTAKLRAAKDSAGKRDSVTMSAPDSVERALLSRRGYLATRYQGDSVSFNTTENNLLLFGRPGLVIRDKTRVSGDSISYDDVRRMLRVVGDSLHPARIKDPSQPDEIVAYKPIDYDLEGRRGTAGGVRTKANSGSIWCINADRVGIAADSVGSTSYGKDARLTTDCSDDPQYYFEVGEYKDVNKRYMVARPAILHIGEVPVLWIPWLFQDERRGRRSGLLTPKFGFADIVRNSPTYRRTVDNLGFYFAPSNYYDTELSMDWRSGARPTENDPGWLKYNGTLRYNWLDRFITGYVGASRENLDNGSSNLQLSWMHNQSFSASSKLNMSLNYVSSTAIQQQTAIDPIVALANIQSSATYQKAFGPATVNLGFGQTQHPGRSELDRDFPTVNINSKPVALASWLTWTPSFSTSTQSSYHLDSPSEFGYRYITGVNGALDSAKTDRNSRSTSMTIGSPLKAGFFTIAASARVSDRENDYPEAKLVIDPADTTIHRMVTYKRTYLTTLDWDLGVNLPQFFQGRWNLTPSVTLQNVDPGGFLVRSERTGTKYVSQSKRFVYGASISPTLYHRTGPIGPFLALRSSINPVLTYGYSPTASVTDEYLGALGRTRAGYLGALAQNRVSLGFSTTLEGKLRPRNDSTPVEQAKKIRLLSLQLSTLDYDFERARVTHHSGFATDRFTYTVRSDLLPGMDFSADYSLFDAPSISDTAHFKPYLEGVHATLTLGSGTGGLGLVGRLFQWATGEKPDATVPKKDSTGTPFQANPGGGADPLSGNPVAGRSRSAFTDIPTGQGWQASFTFSSNHPRPPHGSNVQTVDPAAICHQFLQTNPAQYDICISQQSPLNVDNSQNETTGGGLAFSYPAQASVTGNLRFNLTTNWAASWATSYDLERGAFATQILTLQRDIHDWRAIFGFTQASNGNFSFHFLITLRPAPDLKFPFDRTSYGAQR